jgi:peroxiredoxin
MSPAVLALAAILPVPDFELTDLTGTRVRLSAYAENRPVVLVFISADCPLANLYAPRLAEMSQRLATAGPRFLAIDSVPQDGAAALARFAREHKLPFPILKDPDARVAAACRATRTPQVVLLDRDRRVRYRGRTDDQYEPGARNRGRPTRHDLAEAIADLLAGRSIAVAETVAAGCRIPQPQPLRRQTATTYHRDIAPIIRDNCQLCHRPAEVAPFALLTYADVRHWAPMIVEVTGNGAMPPWHANPEHGRFRNERRLTAAQREAIARWAEEGCPEGEPVAPDAPAPASGEWAIGKPDLILKMPTPYRVPAEGIIEYQRVILDPGAATDLWVTAAEVRPGNRRLLHHCNVYLHPPDGDPNEVYETNGTLGSHCLTAFTPGSGPLRLPPGMAKRIPAGWKLNLVLHYTPIGTAAEDQTSLGLVLADPRDVHKEVATKLIKDLNLRIPPGAAAHRVEGTWQAEQECLLLSMFPHMHFRGKSFRFVAEYPDRPPEILLDVPAYDFNWQHRYELAEAKVLPAGTVVRCIAVYDNSAGNPSNPDPTAEVRAGLQSTDEMFNGFFEIALTEQDLQAPPPQTPGRLWFVLAGCLGALAIVLGLCRWRSRRAAAI